MPIWKGRAAEKAGLTAETVITHVEGTQVPNRDDLMVNIRSRKAGDQVTLTVVSPSNLVPEDVIMTLKGIRISSP